MNIFNNLSYYNGFTVWRYADTYGFWVQIADLGSQDENQRRTFKNNLSYGNYTDEIFIENSSYYTHAYNSWDTPPNVTLDGSDFVSLDIEQLYRARNSDGSLPYITFGKLRVGSDCINVGINLGIITDGTEVNTWDNPTPSIGAFEYSEDDQGIFEILKGRIHKYSIL
jgi:pectate lyase